VEVAFTLDAGGQVQWRGTQWCNFQHCCGVETFAILPLTSHSGPHAAESR